MQVPDETKRTTEDNSIGSSRPSKVRKSASIEIVPEKTAKERLQDFKDPDYLTAHEIELGSSADSDGGNPLEHMREQFERRRADRQHSELTSHSDLTSFDDDSKSIDSAQEALSELDSLNSMSAPVSRQTSQAGIRKDVDSGEFVMVSENDVKDAVKIANEALGKISPRKGRGLREGVYDKYIFQ